MKKAYYDVIIVGGGAAGFFAAINAAEKNENLSILILERSKDVLQKVKISGGGRCNVTNACFDPIELSMNYPRGEKALIGPFNKFATGDMMYWLEQHGVPTKIEADNRVFPESNTSQTIIDCFTKHANKHKIELQLNTRVDDIQVPKDDESNWIVKNGGNTFQAKKLVIATGSIPQVWKMMERIGHNVIPAVPSLFTFNIKDKRIEGLMGLSVPLATINIVDEALEAEGPLLITHWGLSGPAVLKLSAWGARLLNAKKYEFKIKINWLGTIEKSSVEADINEFRKTKGKEKVMTKNSFDLPKRFWQQMLKNIGIKEQMNWADLSKKQIHSLAQELTEAEFEVKGKSTFKEEFVTAGGVDLKEINFKKFESKIHPNLFFAGEVLDIDAITGGFNFQAAWTGGWIISENI